MSYQIDTDRVIDFLAGQAEAVGLLNGLQPSGIAISVITYMEIVEGLAGNPAPKRARLVFRAFLRKARVLVVSRAIAERAGGIRYDLRRRKRPIDHRALDLIVAATAIEHGLILVTRNTRDYVDIAGIRLYQPDNE